ncbi:PREDICTED: THAP domain-containing protein 5-like [Trachymyrmex cornetzi]|uniref:THAP domain-containing protein 5-like n=1 Tax=Trachymyrmex cornetzi TaxID=471704 RepID=UPI00084F453F|nr:PREDICTED: THAP domain-containing protein 5-like [Trachymyrmex cornetzi]
MPSYCSAYKCSNNSDQGYALVRYPHDETLKRKWIAAVGRGKNWSPSSSQKLCEIHFKPSEIEFVAGRKRVKFDSVPSRFCTCSSEDRENCHGKLKKKQKNRNNPYQRQTVSKHNDCCIVIQPPVKKNEILADKQEEFIEELRKENDILKQIVSFLQKVLENRKK